MQESGFEGLQPEASLAGLYDALEGNVPVDVVHRALREINKRADAVLSKHQQTMAAEGQ
ncbi:hypothetical protein [Serratia symbiotica]|uniref:hypothetical protein n=1 Tax=Serratia symbiotica TaxID=138074 RepID=UPI003CC8BDBA